MFKNPFSFEGRIRRKEYGITYIIYIVVSNLASVMFGVTGDSLTIVVGLLIFIPLIWFILAQGAKRCHDRGNNGWYQIIPLYALWMIFADGEIGPNQYGDNPKGLGNDNEIDNIGKSNEDE